MNVVLISTYELGRQPFGLASPAAWLRAEPAVTRVDCFDLSRQKLAEAESPLRAADLVAFYLPMHTATRLALQVIPMVAAMNPAAHLCGYGLYAPMNGPRLSKAGIATVLGGEFETGLVELARRMATDGGESRTAGTSVSAFASSISLARQQFMVPERAGLPALKNYAHLTLPDGSTRVVGYTEASRGCKHLCRHCPVVPVYEGAFRVVQREVVLEDIAQQIGAGAQHITFGDPDFFNGVGHACAIVEEMHRRHPEVTYDATIKVEHLLRHSDKLALLKETGCAFVISAVESFDDEVLAQLEKGHTYADFVRCLAAVRAAGLYLAPTFLPFTPWTTLEGYQRMLRTVAELDLVENVPPVQYAIRLLIPAGSRSLELDGMKAQVAGFDEETLAYPWANADARVDALQREVEELVERHSKAGASRWAIFEAIWKVTQAARGGDTRSAMPYAAPDAARQMATIPYMTEPWYC